MYNRLHLLNICRLRLCQVKTSWSQGQSGNNSSAATSSIIYGNAKWYKRSNHFLLIMNRKLTTKTMLVFFCLAVVSDNWTAVGWDFKRNQINVYAPGQIEQNKENKWAVHTAVVRKLREALKSCVTAFFDGWPVDAWNWPLVFIDPYPRHTQFTQRLFTLRYYHILNIQTD